MQGNNAFKEWTQLLPSPGLAVAITDRLIDDATVLRFSGKPWRRPRDIPACAAPSAGAAGRHGAPLDDE